ncbi:MAG: hypothetical protein ACYC6M_10165 [Terriglobales bacterium]
MLFPALDLLWTLLAAGLLVLAARRGSSRAWFAALCLGLILFPAVSADDDQHVWSAALPHFISRSDRQPQIGKAQAKVPLHVDRVWDFLNSILPSDGLCMRRMDVSRAALCAKSPQLVCIAPSSPISRGPPLNV